MIDILFKAIYKFYVNISPIIITALGFTTYYYYCKSVSLENSNKKGIHEPRTQTDTKLNNL